MQEKLFEKIPDGFLMKWQEIADLIANIMTVPAALIMKTENELMEVFTSSNTGNNPYKVGDKEHWCGLYCETVIKTQKKLRIPNALKDKYWDKNPDIKLGMIAYLGYPINFPDQKPFGTLCVLDNKERQFSDDDDKLLLQFKKVIELDLALIFSLGLKENYNHAEIIQKLSSDNKECQTTNEELKKTEEELIKSAKELKHSHDLMNYIIKHNRSAIAVHDKDLKYIYVSQRYIDDFKVKESDVIGKHHYDVFPDLPKKWKEVHQKSLAGEVSSAEEDPFYREDGSVEWTRWECRPWYESDGSIGGIIIYTEVINERIEAEEKLKSNYALLQIAGETARFGGWNVDLEKYISNWSDAVADIHEMPHGYAPPVEEGINFYAPEWKDKITQVFNDCALKGIPYDEEMEIITSKGNRLWVRTIGRAVKDENGKISKVQGSFQDITERKKAEKLLQDERQQLLSIFNGIEEAIYIADPVTYEVIFVNNFLKKMLGKDLMGKKCFEQFQGFKAPCEFCTNQIILKNPGEVYQWEYYNPNLNRHYLLFDRIIKWTDGRDVRFEMAIDITQRKQADEALQRIEWMLSKKPAAVKSDQVPLYGDLSELNTSRLIFDSVGENVLKDIADDFLRLLESSSAIYEKNGDYALGIFASGWCRFMDQASRELCGTGDNSEALNCGKWLCHESCWKEASKPAMESGRPVDIECQGGIHLYAMPIVAGGKVIGAINFGYGDPPQDTEKLSELAQKYKVPLGELMKKAKEYETRPLYIIEMAKDRLQASANLIGEIVSRKTTEKEILKLNEELEQRVVERTEQLEALNKELEAFSYSVSHDLRAPLRHINGYVDLLNKKFHADLPETAKHYLASVTDAARQMGTLIEDLLHLSRTGRQELRKTKIEMNAMVKEVVETIKQDTEKREITWKLQELPQVFGDYSLLKQVWVNLLDNAVKFTRNTQKAEISIGFEEEEKNFVFFVRDKGVGFDMKYAHKLFGVFQRLHTQVEFEGTGIGLANVKRIIHKHNGQVWAEAEPGKGAAFFFSLPKNRKDTS